MDLPNCEAFIATDGWCKQHVLPEDYADADEYNLRECRNCKLSRERIIDDREYLETLFLMSGRASVRKEIGLSPADESLDFLEETVVLEIQRWRIKKLKPKDDEEQENGNR